MSNGLRAGWLSLGHSDDLGDIMPLLSPDRGAQVPQSTLHSQEQESPGVHVGNDSRSVAT